MQVAKGIRIDLICWCCDDGTHRSGMIDNGVGVNGVIINDADDDGGGIFGKAAVSIFSHNSELPSGGLGPKISNNLRVNSVDADVFIETLE